MDFFTVMIILITLVVFVFIILIAFVMKKGKDTKEAAFLEAERTQMLQRVSKKRKKLIAPKATIYKQLTDAMTFERVEDVRTITLSGTLHNSEGKSVVAFERIERGLRFTGQLVAMTKKQTFVYEFENREITIFCEDELLGFWTKAGLLLNAEKQQIGTLKRTTTTHELILNNRKLATIQKAPSYDHIARITEVSEVFKELKYGTSLLSIHDAPTKDEEKWLTALAIFEITFYGNTPVA
jgi:hypothetical protein